MITVSSSSSLPVSISVRSSAAFYQFLLQVLQTLIELGDTVKLGQE